MNQGKYFYIFIGMFLTGCGSVPLKRLSPEPYTRASDFANEVLKKTSCMGQIDSFLFKPGIINTDAHGVLTFSGNYSDTHCNSDDFRQTLEDYCRSKGGEYRQEWCVKEDEPIFRIEKFIIQEKSSSLTDAQWRQIARARLGYVSTRESDLKQTRANSNSRFSQQQREIRIHSNVHASIGDFICREDLQSNGKYYQGAVYYGAYVEDIQHGRLILTRHFRTAFVS